LGLDGLRAFAIIPVILSHCYPRSGIFQWIAPFGEAGWVGVDLFFVLSGYLITESFSKLLGNRITIATSSCVVR
jgi:peptidoglycan/LPS O-acetylase OafA/YrhL